jgi:hypothetical protein
MLSIRAHLLPTGYLIDSAVAAQAKFSFRMQNANPGAG